MRASLSQLCAAQDVALDPDSIPDTASLYALELGEDAEADLRAATALLGRRYWPGTTPPATRASIPRRMAPARSAAAALFPPSSKTNRRTVT